jgi:hypothetical protein
MSTVLLQSGSHGDWNVATPLSVVATAYKKLLQRRLKVTRSGNFFTDKVERIRTAAVDVPPPDFCEKATDVHFDTFDAISVDDVITSIHRLPDKTSAADPISTPVLKLVTDLLVPYITELFNCSMSSGQVPQCFKRAFITPIVKLLSAHLLSVCALKNSATFVARQLLAYLQVHNLLPHTQWISSWPLD